MESEKKVKMISPTELKLLCEKYGLSPSKAYGQNYLIHEKPILDILEAGELIPDDIVVEIGPGFGELTLPVSQRVKKVYSFEIERTLEEYWEDTARGTNIEIIWGNALKQLPERAEEFTNFKVMANLPYQVTSKAIRMLLELPNQPERIIMMVQKEVAERICALPGNMSILAASVQYYGDPSIVSVVKAGNFWPAPKVDSAIVAVHNITKPGSKEDEEQFFRVLRAGFSAKRKQLAKNLSSSLKIDRKLVEEALRKNGIEETIRAEELSMENWRGLSHELKKYL